MFVFSYCIRQCITFLHDYCYMIRNYYFEFGFKKLNNC